jgi:hypothetical protein
MVRLWSRRHGWPGRVRHHGPMVRRLIGSVVALGWAAGAVLLAVGAARWSTRVCVDFPRGVGESRCISRDSGFDWDLLLTLAGGGAVLLLGAVVALWRDRWRVVAVAAALGVVGVMPATWEYFVVPIGERVGL